MGKFLRNIEAAVSETCFLKQKPKVNKIRLLLISYHVILYIL